MQVHEATGLRRLLCLCAPSLLLGCDVLIRQQRLGVPHRGITHHALVRSDDYGGLFGVGSTQLHPNCLPICRHRPDCSASNTVRHASISSASLANRAADQ